VPQADGWNALLDRLTEQMSPEWMKHARTYGDQPWIRLVLMVDAHAFMAKPGATEKIAMTMADLAGDREKEAEGWNALMESARDTRFEIISSLVDQAESLLPLELQPYFSRSVEPLSFSG
jgi:hypothetical protein